MIWYCTTLNHFGNAALVWKLVACPLNYWGWWCVVVGWWRPIGPHVFYVLCTRPTLSLPSHVFSIFHRAPSKHIVFNSYASDIPLNQLWLPMIGPQLQSCTHVGSRCPRQSWARKKSASQRVRVCATLPICQTSILTNLSGGSSDILICQTITRR